MTNDLRLYTVGHSTRSLEELVALLREHAVERLVDARRYPGSRRNPQFAKEALARALPGHAIEYVHEPDLGGRRAPHFQGTQQENGGLGTVFGAGLRCVGGTVQRLGSKSIVGGASQSPASGDDPISWLGGITVPGTVVTYQAWYHDANGTCAGADFNLTNGWEITWAP